ncbi:hypothetical protein ACLGI4_20755 [Streptomyces sp. HMX112]|uniref:hypothetical protein n=1 Tax=Streptomyces sp. HMX112 TaxID=3390850 RepID=UPI003A8001DD
MSAPLTDPHRRLVADVLAAGESRALALAGTWALRAHGLVGRGGREAEVEVATENPEPMDDIAATVRAGLEERGWRVLGQETGALSAGLIVGAPGTGDVCEVGILKEVLWRPPSHTEYGPVLALEDVVGTRVRALAERGLAADLADVHAAADRWSHAELEELGRRHAPDAFDLTDLQARLAGSEWVDDREFAARGLDGEAVGELRRWAQEWADDIAERLLEGAVDVDGEL